tara:strand:+ start:1092 stop:1550 length:459 start_codon:yes stop_codon:yes gene_type:complete
MKKSDLVKIIREAVRAEVKAVLKEEFGKKTSTNEEFSSMMSHADNLFNGNKSKQSFTKNPVLNDVLNETANEAWPTMGGKTLNANHAQGGKAGLAAMMGMQAPDQMFGGKPTAQQMAPDDRKHVEVPEEVGKALTRDYSKLMKAIDKKRQNK